MVRKSRKRRSRKRKSKKRRSRKRKSKSRRKSRKRKSKKRVSYKLVVIKKSNKAGKKMMAVFKNKQTGREKTVHFGAKSMSDYTKHKDSKRKARYLLRHKKNENWSDPTTAGALSKWILWNKPSLRASIASYKQRFFKA